MILPERVLGMSGTMWMRLGAGDFADHGFDGGSDFFLHSFAWKNAGLQRNVNFRHAAFDVVDNRNNGGFGDFGRRKAGGFEFLGAQAMAGDVDDIVDAAEDAVVAIGGQHRAISGVVWPIAPIFAVRILVVLFVVLADEALRIAPDGLHDAGPRIANANVSGVVGAGGNFFAFFVPNHGIDAEAGGPALPGFMGSSAGLVVQRKPPVSVCHQVSTMTASPLPTTS